MEHYNAVLYTQAVVDLVTCWLASALAGRLFGRPRRAGCALARGAVPFHRQLRRHRPLRNPGACHHCAGVLRLRPMAGRGPRIQPLALDHLRRAGLLHPAAPGTGPLRRSSSLRDALGFAGASRQLPTCHVRARRSSPQRSVSFFRWYPGRPVTGVHSMSSNRSPRSTPTIPANWRRSDSAAGTAPGPSSSPPPRTSTGTTPATTSTSTDLPQRAFDAGSPSASADLRERTAALFADYNAGIGHSQEVNPQSTPASTRSARSASAPTRSSTTSACPVARVLNMILRPRTEMMDVPLDWWKWREHRAQSAFAAAYAALNLAYIVVGVAGFLAWKRRAWHSPRRAAKLVSRTGLCHGRQPHPARRPAAHNRQLRAALHAGVLPRALRLGRRALRPTAGSAPHRRAVAGDNEGCPFAQDSYPSSAGPTRANPRC